MRNNNCDCGCSRPFGMVRQRWLNFQFATSSCKSIFLKKRSERRRVHRMASAALTLSALAPDTRKQGTRSLTVEDIRPQITACRL